MAAIGVAAEGRSENAVANEFLKREDVMVAFLLAFVYPVELHRRSRRARMSFQPGLMPGSSYSID